MKNILTNLSRHTERLKIEKQYNQETVSSMYEDDNSRNEENYKRQT